MRQERRLWRIGTLALALFAAANNAYGVDSSLIDEQKYLASVQNHHEGSFLNQIRDWQLAHQTAAEFRSHAENEIRSIEGEPVRPRAKAFSSAQFMQLIASIKTHPVVGLGAARKYDPYGEIRFCFGIATYSHHIALAAGVDPQNIRKVFIIGRRHWSSGSESEMHSATVIRSDDGHWYVVDRVFKEPKRLEQWFEFFYKQSPDHRLSLFITSAERFGPDIPHYIPNLMFVGDDLRDDKYNGYFTDLFVWLSSPDNVARAGFFSKPLSEIPWPSSTRDIILNPRRKK